MLYTIPNSLIIKPKPKKPCYILCRLTQTMTKFTERNIERQRKYQEEEKQKKFSKIYSLAFLRGHLLFVSNLARSDRPIWTIQMLGEI